MSSSKAVKSKRIEVVDTSTTDILVSVPAATPGNIVSGEVVSQKCDGQIYVDYPQNPLGYLPARTLVEDLYQGAKVLLAFDGGDPARPIILGIIHERARTGGRTIYLRATRIVLEAQDELLLQCGEGSIAARDDKITVKGRDVVSRATRTNKLRGATVLIN